MSSHCEECGGKVWDGISYEPHSDQWHQAQRRILMRIIRRRLHEELVFREEAQYAAMRDDVLVVWRVVLPTDVLYSQSHVPGVAWGGLHREALLTWMVQGIRDLLESSRGIRVHPSRVTYRVFDERGK